MRPNTPPPTQQPSPPAPHHATRKPGKHFNDFMSQTDDDWDADLGEETADDILGGKFWPPKSIEYRPPISGTRAAGNGRPITSSDTRTSPSYPTPRRRDSQGLKPQFAGLVRGVFGHLLHQCFPAQSVKAEVPSLKTPETPYT